MSQHKFRKRIEHRARELAGDIDRYFGLVGSRADCADRGHGINCSPDADPDPDPDGSLRRLRSVLPPAVTRKGARRG